MISLIALSLISIQTNEDTCSHTKNAFNCVQYVSNYDGDTLTVTIPNVHPFFGEKAKVRVFGIDTSEMSSKDGCGIKSATEAKEFVHKRLSEAKRINLVEVKKDKYFRILARVIVDGDDLSKMLVQKKLAYEYFGQKKPKANWCSVNRKEM